MQTYTYVSKGKFERREKPKPVLQDARDAIVRVTLASICSSDLHIKHGSVPRAVPGITVGHEMVGIVEAVGDAVTHVKPGDRVTVNVETFCGECFFCKKGYVNNCTDKNGGWALGCRIDGGQAEYVRVPFADTGLNRIPDGVTDRQALLVGDVLATGYWAARISEITEEDTVLIIGAGPTGICTLLCVMLKKAAADHRLRKGPRPHTLSAGALSRGADGHTGGVRCLCAGQQRTRRRRCSSGGRRRILHLPPCVGVCKTQCHCNGGRAV